MVMCMHPYCKCEWCNLTNSYSELKKKHKSKTEEMDRLIETLKEKNFKIDREMEKLIDMNKNLLTFLEFIVYKKDYANVDDLKLDIVSYLNNLMC